MKPLVSILIPAYNAQEWIVDTIQSALGQTWPNKEIIIVDDGSTDQTLSVAKRFAFREVSVVTQKNQGAAATRNNAFALCRGDYIQWLDADDLLSPDKIASQMKAAEKSQSRRTLLSSGWAHFMFRPAKAKFIPTPLWQDLSPLEWLLRKWENGLHMQTATWLTSRELSEAAGPWDTRLLSDDDGEYFSRVIKGSEGIRFVPDAKVFYRTTGSGSLSYIGWSNRKLDSQLVGMRLQINYLRTMKDDERVRAACLCYLQKYIWDFFPERPDLVKQAEELAASIGGRLEPPQLRWKYAWMENILGYKAGKRAQLLLPNIRSRALRAWDKVMLHLENRVLSSNANMPQS